MSVLAVIQGTVGTLAEGLTFPFPQLPVARRESATGAARRRERDGNSTMVPIRPRQPRFPHAT